MSKKPAARVLSSATRDELLDALKTRFDKNPRRHRGIEWANVVKRLAAHPDKLWSLNEMERTGGEPDVISVDAKTSELMFVDCADESPDGRRSLCYDRAGWESRKEARPANTAIDMAAAMGVELLDEGLYRLLQSLGKFDQKTSSWLITPPAIRELGGAIFGDRRYDAVWIYHNGAQSYYAARGFRGVLRV
jgi:hypothetical protein